MNAYLIDPFERTIVRSSFDGTLRDAYRLLKCSLAQSVPLYINDLQVLVDEEGLDRDGQEFFQIVGYSQPLAGYGLVLGSNNEGSFRPAGPSLRTIQAMTTFPKLKFTGISTRTATMGGLVVIVNEAHYEDKS